AVTYRMGPHSTADDPTRYREAQEVESWRARDPVQRYRRYLEERGLWSGEDEERAQAEADRTVLAAIQKAEQLPPPPRESMFEDVYAELPWHLREERDEILGDQAGA